MQNDLFIPESWIEVTTWVEEIQLVAMKITRGKPNRVWCMIVSTTNCVIHGESSLIFN
jgi:hypothetical protein